MSSPIGRIDVHSHLLPNVDDGCATLEDSLACGRKFVEAGYTHCFCTPHIWPNLPHNTVDLIRRRTTRLQEAFDEAKVPLKLLPGGELNLRADMIGMPLDDLPTYGMDRRYCLFDIWAEKIPAFFWKAIKHLQSLGLTVIIAHPERMRAVQDAPQIADEFVEHGLLLQGNLQCLGDPPHTHTRRLAERFLLDRRYFLLGSDCHNLASLQIRLDGLKNAIALAGEAEVWRLTSENPRQLLEVY
jgi:protein-tyrosine phosphatase